MVSTEVALRAALLPSAFLFMSCDEVKHMSTACAHGCKPVRLARRFVWPPHGKAPQGVLSCIIISSRGMEAGRWLDCLGTTTVELSKEFAGETSRYF